MDVTRRQTRLTHKLETVFERPQATVLAEVITDAYNELVKTDDFNELKAIVKELAQAQNRTGQRMEELAQAQNRTEQRMEELTQAQKELTQAQKETQYEIQTLSKRLGYLGSTVGGLGNSMGYALENEAYRMLPPLLKEKYGLEITERFIRTYVGGQEINLFGKARRNGEELLVVGESKSRLDERRKRKKKQKDIWEQLSEKVEAVREAYPDTKIIPLIITHHARPGTLKQAEEEGVIVVQSFEW